MRFPRIVLFILAGSVSLSAKAACNDPSNWWASPGNGVRTFVGYKQDLQYGFATEFNGGLPGHGGEYDEPYPPELPKVMLNGNWNGALAKDGVSVISYYEPNDRGGWRVCRVETWVPRESGQSPSEKDVAADGKNILIKALLGSFKKLHSEIYLYDGKGRIQEKFSAYSEKMTWGSDTGSRECFRFNDMDRPELYVNAKVTNKCPIGEPDIRDNFRRIKYVDLKDGRANIVWYENHMAFPDNQWTKRITFKTFFKPTDENEGLWFQGGNARVYPLTGVTQIIGGYNIGSLDQSDSNKYPYASGVLPPVEYYFTNPPVPMSVLENPDAIYQYDRRRETEVTDGVKLVEYYAAGVHLLRERFYIASAGGQTLRQEQYDDQGRLKRVINLGFLKLDKNNGGFYFEHLGDAKKSAKLRFHELYYRVWEFDVGGKEKLVALGWNAKVSVTGKREPVDEADVIYGTPDGVQRWKTKQEFFKAFDFDAYADRAFPDRKRK